MNYSEYEGKMESLIQSKLKEIEEKNTIKVLHAVESGSRAWGFASPDSDYDVRFMYIRPLEYYLKLEETKDFLDWELNELLDINGWDITKALRQFHRSNATLFEWANSPIVYKTTDEWKDIYHVAKEYFSLKSTMYHYYGTARKNYEKYLTEKDVKYKKYFYVLRPILAYKWIREKQCPPPVLFQELVDFVLEDEMKGLVERLTRIKMQMTESEKGPVISELNAWIEQNLTQMEQEMAALSNDGKPEWEPLNGMFLRLHHKLGL